MADERLTAILKQGVEVWNRWRKDNPDARIDLSGLDLRNETSGRSFLAPEGCHVDNYDLSGSEFTPRYSARYGGIDLSHAILTDARLYDIDFTRANFQRAILDRADLERCNFYEANLSFTFFHEANLRDAYLKDADFSWSRAERMDARGAVFRNLNLKRTAFHGCLLNGVNFHGANLDIATLMSCSLRHADFRECTLTHARFDDSNLYQADFSGTTLRNCSFDSCTLVGTNFNDTDLSGTRIYGISCWDVVLNEATRMNDLVITDEKAPVITVDDIEVAQFIYLLLNNTKIRNVINTITSKSVLLLGRFTPERKPALDRMKEALRRKNYLPIIFDFEKPDHKDLTETVATLAQLSCFVIADLTDAKSIPQELQRIIPNNPSLPVQPVIWESDKFYGMFADLLIYPSVLAPYVYESVEQLMENINERVIAPSLRKMKEIEDKRELIRKMVEHPK